MNDLIYEASDDDGTVLTVAVEDGQVVIEMLGDGVTLPPEIAREVAVALNLAVSEIAGDGL